MQIVSESNPLLERSECERIAARLTEYGSYVREVAKKVEYLTPESFCVAPFDDAVIAAAENIAMRKVGERLRYVFLVGIGGANLGAQAVYDGVLGYFDRLNPTRGPRLICVDTCNPALLGQVQETIMHQIQYLDEVMVVVVSKSGGTLETLLNANVVVKALQTHGESWQSRVVIVTEEGSSLAQAGITAGIEIVSMPHAIGGRYSVFTAVGLVPLALCGIDIAAFCEGARRMRTACLQEDVLSNPAAVTAATLFSHWEKGVGVVDAFLFNPELESLGKWWRQLIGESLGKRPAGQEELSFHALVPTVSIGSVDLHSMGQLYIGLSHDRFTFFVMAAPSEEGDVDHGELVHEPLLEGRGAEELMTAIYRGTQGAYAHIGLPFFSLVLEDVSSQSIGEWMMWSMMTTIYLAHLMGVNAFDQPAVEEYKVRTRDVLKGERI